MRARFLPHPLLSFALFVVWLLLANSLSINSIVFAALLGILIPVFTQPYWPDMPTLSRPGGVIAYVAIVIFDIVVANIQVALIVLFKPRAKLQPAWVSVPLEIRTPEAITMLAGTITLTPGTVSCDLTEDGRAILVHCLHAPDPAGVSAEIKSRYERRLKEIFE